MLTRDEILGLAGTKSEGNYFVSCFLNVDPVANTRGDYMIHAKNMLKEALEKQEKDVRRKIRPDVEKIEAFLFSHKRSVRKGLALFSSAEADFWREIHFSVTVGNGVYVDTSPFIKPLLYIADRYPRYAVMLIDREHARLFVIHLGEVEEYREVFTDNVPGRHKKGGWFSLGQKSYERHTDYHVDLHLKDVLKELELLVSAGDITRIVAGGAEEALVRAKELFGKVLADKVIGSFPATMTAQANEVIGKAQAVIDSYEEKEKNSLVEQLLTMTMKKESAALGIENVLASLREGRVMKLVYLRDYSADGYSCGACGLITAQKIESCPFCNSAAHEVPYLIDLAAQKALEQGASVEVISAHEGLRQAGRIGAFLRY